MELKHTFLLNPVIISQNLYSIKNNVRVYVSYYWSSCENKITVILQIDNCKTAHTKKNSKDRIDS
jgi:hypothetical protein